MEHQTSTLAQASIAVCVTLAVFFYGGTTQLFQLGIVTLLLIATVVHTLRCLRTRSLPWSAVHSWLIFYVLLLTINIFTSVYPENTRLVVWMFLLLPMVVLIAGHLTSEKWRRLLVFLSLPMAFTALWGGAEFFSSTERASGPGVDPNSWASSINIAFFVFASAFMTLNNRWLPLLLVFLLILAAASFMSYSRVGLIVFFSGLVFVCIVAMSKENLRRRALVLLVSVAACYGVLQLYRSTEAATQHTEGYTLDPGSYGWSLRFSQWQSALDQYADYPFVGSGLGTFKVLYPSYRTLGDKHTGGNYVHNDYLQLLAEVGPAFVLMLLIFVAFLSWRLVISIKRLLFYADTKEQLIKREIEAVILIVAIGTVLVHAIMNFTLYSLLNQILMGCALARLLSTSQLMRNVPVKTSRKWLPQAAIIMLSVYVLVVNYADAVSHDLVYRGGVLPLDRHDSDDQYRVFEILTFIRSFRGETSANRFAMATFYRTSFDNQPLDNVGGRRSLAIATAIEYQSGLEINPYSTDVRVFLQNFLEENPWLMSESEIYQTPEKLLRDGLALFPLRIRAHVLLADFLQNQGQMDEAYQLLQAALPLTYLRYENYHSWELTHQRMLLRAAKARGDTDTLRALLEKIS